MSEQRAKIEQLEGDPPGTDEKEEVLKYLDDYLIKVRCLIAEKDALEEICTDLRSELASARHQIAMWERETLSTNNITISGIDNIDKTMRASLEVMQETMKEISTFNKVAELSNSLELATNSKKAQDVELLMLRAENTSLKRENTLLRSNIENASRSKTSIERKDSDRGTGNRLR